MLIATESYGEIVYGVLKPKTLCNFVSKQNSLPKKVTTCIAEQEQ